MSDPNKIFSEKLRAIRKGKDFSQDKLAELTKIDRSYIGRIDRGEVNITLEMLFKIAVALECDPGEMLPSLKQILH
ncbi:helix-turn-helix transcriptional regulator [Pseudoalteromonas neustonica]|uniref:Helix-turn-helix transcriptional regulator n=1 Tax=Pseudoalteromonas neustonica TaxID=1840331 RepID=A0ABU9U697_9GAMM